MKTVARLLLITSILSLILLLTACGEGGTNPPEVKGDDIEYVSNGDGTCYVKSIRHSEGEHVSIDRYSPEGDLVVAIGDEAFSGCTDITGIRIPDNVIHIGKRAFAGCTSLRDLEIPGSVEAIGDEAFMNCDSLTSVTILSSLTEMGERAFAECDNLTIALIYGDGLDVSNGAFSGCKKLEAVMLDTDVAGILEDAFSSCPSLAKIYYTGNPETFKDLIVDATNENFSSCDVYFLRTSEPTEEGNFWHYNNSGEIEEW